MRRCILMVLYLFVRIHACAQSGAGAEQSLELMAENSGESEFQDDSYVQAASYFKEHPLDLNTADEESLQDIFMITGVSMTPLVLYRQRFGPLGDICELQAVPGFSIGMIRKILPLVCVSEQSDLGKTSLRHFSGGEHALLLRYSRVLESSAGYRDSLRSQGKGYQGSRDRWLLRYQYNFRNHVQYGLTGEKDAGEPFLKKGNRLGFDFYSAHLFIRNTGLIRTLALGDFTINMGQGLVEWQGFSFGKGMDIASMRKQSPVIRPYRSFGEFLFHRGIGITLAKGDWSFTGFGSWRNLDATMQSDSLQGNAPLFTSINTSGLHRTDPELNKKGELKQQAWGAVLRRKFNNGHAGLNYAAYRYQAAMAVNGEAYDRYSARGKFWGNLSADAALTLQRVHLFGEVAVSRQGGFALVTGMMMSLAPAVDIGLLYRNINREYRAMNASAFTENPAPGNEKGLYTAVSVRPLPRWQLDVYADWFRFPWLVYGASAPSGGREYHCRLSYRPGRQNEVYFRFRQERGESDAQALGNPVRGLSAYIKKSWRVHASVKLNERFVLRSRVEMNHISGLPYASNGFLSYADLIYKPLMSRLSVTSRVLVADTDDYQSRVYCFENDVLYGMSVPVFSGRQRRAYIITEYDLARRLRAWAKLGITINSDNNLIGSGLDEINGRHKTELRLQFIYEW